MKRKETEYRLDPGGVDAASLAIREWLTALGVQKREITRIGLVCETMLLRLSERYGGDAACLLSLGKRMGTPCIRFRWPGEAFDPTASGDDPVSEWTNRMLTGTGLTPSWHYRPGWNELVQRVPSMTRRTGMVMLAALALAVLLGLLGPVLPAGVTEFGSRFVLGPVSDTFIGVLNVFLGPMVFLSVLTGICGIGNAADFSRIGKLMVKRFLLLAFLISAAGLVLSRPFFTLAAGSGGGGAGADGLLELILDIFPNNPVKPFADGNIMQIIFMAVLIGVILLILGERCARLREVLSELSDLVTEIIGVVCRLLPLYLFTSLTRQFWANGAAVLLSLGKPLLLFMALCALLLAVKTALTCLRLKVRASVLLRKMFPGMLIGFATGSSAVAYTVCTEANEKKLGISPGFNRMAFPLGSTLNQPGMPTLFVLTAFYAAERCGAGGGLGWFLTLWIVSTLLAYAVPPVAGGTLACLGVLFAQLGIPSEALAVAGTLSLFLDMINTGTRIGFLHLELTAQADILGALDKEILRRP